MLPYKLHVVMVTEIVKQEPTVLKFVGLIMVFFSQVPERTHTEERKVERDILKEMFPYEVSTPTGIRYC